MRKIALIIGVAMVFGTSFAQAGRGSNQWNGKIIRATGGAEISQNDLVREISQFDNIVMGEKHYTLPVHQVQGAIIDGVVTLLNRAQSFTVAWEFLNVTEQPQTKTLFDGFMAGKLSANQFLIKTQGNPDAIAYAPVLEAIKKYQGEFIGVNLTRQEISPVSKGGISAADPRLVPPNFELGSEGYRERFAETMQNHVPPSALANYYAAQCLKDDVMAYHMLQDSAANLRFLVTGSFHADFNDGVVMRLKVRAPEQKTVSVRIVDASDYTAEELASVIHDPKYGDVADYVYFVNEPGTITQLKQFQINL